MDIGTRSLQLPKSLEGLGMTLRNNPNPDPNLDPEPTPEPTPEPNPDPNQA